MTRVEMVEYNIAKEKNFREAFLNENEPNEETKAMWTLADAHNQMNLERARQLDAQELVQKIKISSEVKVKK